MLSRSLNRTHNKIATFALGVWLLFMQCALTYHTASVEKHIPGEQCELCVTAAQFASAVPAGAAFDLPLFQAVLSADAHAFGVHRLLFVAYAIRAPPSPVA